MDLNRPKLKQLAISKIPLFQTLEEIDREHLSETLFLREFQKGNTILLSAQGDKDVMFVADGSVDVKRSNSDGREVILSRLGVGDFFGEIALLTGSFRSADVIAAEDCTVLTMRPGDFERMLTNSPGFVKALLVDLANRVAAASTRITDLALLDVYCRVYRILQSLAQPTNNTLKISGRPTHKELAAMAGTSREMVTRALAKLSQDEVISVADDEILILRELPQ